jgi:hypothetical protein
MAAGARLESLFVRCPDSHESVEAEVGLVADVDEVWQHRIRLTLSTLLALDHRCHTRHESLEVTRVEPRQDEDRVTTTIVVGQSSKPHLLVIAD